MVFILNFLKRHMRSLLFVCTFVLAIALVLYTVLAGGILSAGEKATANEAVPASNINPKYSEFIGEDTAAASSENTTSTAADTTSKVKENAETSKAAPTTAQPTTVSQSTTAQPTTVAATIPFATAIPPKTPADYKAQWDQGYLIAIDNPDTTYACSRVTLTDDDRDLLERLCMGEFGSGGFIGAALIAQAVKDAMCFDGYTNVADVIKYCRYDGSTKMGTNDACRQAVKYIFDDNCDAVQHRIMYMYNPYMVSSAFHESQNFILSYQGIRFFDRWAT